MIRRFTIKKRFTWRYNSYAWSVLLLSVIISGCANSGRDSRFRIDNRTGIEFIGIYGNDTVEIERQNSGWIMNEELKPDPVALDNFFFAFENIDIAGATTGGNLDDMTSRKIVLKGNKKSLALNFYASPGYYLFQHNASTNIYRIKILSAPDAELEKVFSDNPGDWRNRELLSMSPEELEELRVIPKASHGKGFVMRKDSNEFRIFDLQGNELESDRLDKERTLLYASYLDDIYFESEISVDSIIERIDRGEAFYEFFINISGEAGKSFGVYPLYGDDGEPNLFYGAVKFSGKKPVLKVNYANLDPLFQNLDYFTVK